ncbi:MAG TPA: thioredoxin-disulfide reductase [Candidatus Merdenecus merdavium]|nr:thioredoxin-disulfide reductase [Candidatus Merdenecus merdavium]
MDQLYDVIIIGSGPAGLTAAIYAQRARLKTLIIEKEYASGGQIINTYEVDNYPGLQGINGYDMGVKFKEHADQLEAEFKTVEVLDIDTSSDVKVVKTTEGDIHTKSIIIATGARYRKLGIPGEEEFGGRGVSYCATCDGAFFRDRTTVVVGGGDVAVEDAIFLARMSKKVYLIHRRDELRAQKILQEKLFETENIECIWNSTVTEIHGDQQVTDIIVKSTVDGSTRKLDVDGVFIAVGVIPNSEVIPDTIKKTESKYIIANEDCKTNIPGVFVAGDVRTKALRQIITAASDGANAVTSAQEYLMFS